MIFAVTGLITQNNLVLATSRRGDATQWGLPGGKVEQGESPYEALLREMKEETGLDVLEAEEVFVRPIPPNGQVRCYQVTSYLGKPKSVEKGIDVKWANPNDLIAGPFGNWNVHLFNKVNIPFDPCYNYHVTWDVSSQEFVGRCDQYPDLSSYNQNPDLAWQGITTLVKELS